MYNKFFSLNLTALNHLNGQEFRRPSVHTLNQNISAPRPQVLTPLPPSPQAYNTIVYAKRVCVANWVTSTIKAGREKSPVWPRYVRKIWVMSFSGIMDFRGFL